MALNCAGECAPLIRTFLFFSFRARPMKLIEAKLLRQAPTPTSLNPIFAIWWKASSSLLRLITGDAPLRKFHQGLRWVRYRPWLCMHLGQARIRQMSFATYPYLEINQLTGEI